MSATMTEQERESCACWLMPEYPADVWQCEKCHVIRRGDNRLISVGRVIRECFPMSPGIDPDVLENARDRGEQTDRLFGLYVMGKLQSIPAGTRLDVYNPGMPGNGLLQKLMRWFTAQNFKRVESQVLLAAGEYCGVCDLRFDGMLVDLKATYDVSMEHRLQVGGYVFLNYGMEDGGYANYGMTPAYGAAILHVTARHAEARLIPLDVQRITDDWTTTKRFYELVKRGSK